MIVAAAILAIGFGLTVYAVSRRWIFSRKVHNTLYRSEQRLAAIVRAAPDGILVSNAQNRIEFVNPRALELFGYEEAELVGQLVEVLVPERHRERHAGHQEVFFGNPRARQMGKTEDLTAARKDGSEIAVDICLSPVEIDGALGAVTIVRDVEDQRRMARQNRKLAFYDPLTELPNRRLIERSVAAALEAAKARGRTMAVLFIDLDRFKEVNDTFGHSIGDQLLRAVAGRLQASLRAGDRVGRAQPEDNRPSVSRFGGDEFVVLLAEISCPEDAAKVAQRVLNALSEPVSVAGRNLLTNASIGIAIYPTDGGDVETLLRNADASLYQAKAGGRATYRFYADSLNTAAVRRHAVGSRLRSALREGGLRLHYQPVKDAATGDLTGAEALLRWTDRELGVVTPDELIPIAEDTGMMVSLGEWVVEAACDQIREWKEAGFRLVPVSVNVSPTQLCSAGFVPRIKRALQERELSAAALELEITETTILNDSPLVVEALQELNDMGIGLILDDFGTGFSSLTHLVRFPICRVKIDRSFVAASTGDPRSAAVVSGLVALAKRLAIRVTAEGVETLEQLSFLRSNGCHDFQGYLLSPPVPAEVFTGFLEREKSAGLLPI